MSDTLSHPHLCSLVELSFEKIKPRVGDGYHVVVCLSTDFDHVTFGGQLVVFTYAQVCFMIHPQAHGMWPRALFLN